MSSDLKSWAERQRMAFIERVLYWRGWINRRDLGAKFGISLPQATNDLVAYATFSQGQCSYNIRSKRYEAAAGFAPQLNVPGLASDWEDMRAAVWEEQAFRLLEEPTLPRRPAKPEYEQLVVRAIFARQALQMRYWSVNSGTSDDRVISPRLLVSDGLRLHVRAFCHRSEKFKDFNLSRMERLAVDVEAPYFEGEDVDWQRFVTLRIVPNPEREEVERQALVRDYQMQDGVLEIRVRRALKLYTERRLGFVNVNKKELPVLNEMEELLLVEDGRKG